MGLEGVSCFSHLHLPAHNIAKTGNVERPLRVNPSLICFRNKPPKPARQGNALLTGSFRGSTQAM